MKFTVTMKDPDGVHVSLDEVKLDGDLGNLEKDEREVLVETRREKMRAFASQWLEYGEYVELEFDTEAGTCVVVKP